MARKVKPKAQTQDDVDEIYRLVGTKVTFSDERVGNGHLLLYTISSEELFVFSNKKTPYLCGLWRFANA